MKKTILLIALLLFVVSVQAGFVDVVCSNDADPDFDATHEWAFDYDNQLVWLIETYDHPGVDSVNVTGLTDEDPDLTMTKDVTNSNGMDWTGYILTLSDCGSLPNGATFVSGSSPDFAVADVTDYQIVFSDGVVAIGEELNMAFVIHVPQVGEFGFCLNQLAVPEPATMALLGLGGLMAICRKK